MLEIKEFLRSRADSGELYYQSHENVILRFEGWKLKKSEVKESAGYSLRVQKNGRIGFSGTTDPNALDSLLDKALQSAELGEKITLDFPGAAPSKELELFDEKIVNYPYASLVALGEEIVDKLSPLKNECELKIDIGLTRYFEEFQNTSGANFAIKGTLFDISLELTKMEEGDVLIVSEFISETHTNDALSKLPAAIENLRKKYNLAKNIVKLETENLPVIFHPDAVMALLLPLLVGVNGKNVSAGASPLVGKIDTQIFDGKLTIIDDGTVPRKPGSTPYDGEGFPKKPITLVENGYLRNYLLDLLSAKKLNMSPNGAASRGIFSSPAPRTSNIIVGEGNLSTNEIFSAFPKAILIEGLLGIGQGNIISGAFSNPVAIGFLVENGQILGRVKNIAIAGNIYECLKNILAISKEREWKYGAYCFPYIMLDNVSVTGGKNG